MHKKISGSLPVVFYWVDKCVPVELWTLRGDRKEEKQGSKWDGEGRPGSTCSRWALLPLWGRLCPQASPITGTAAATGSDDEFHVKEKGRGTHPELMKKGPQLTLVRTGLQVDCEPILNCLRSSKFGDEKCISFDLYISINKVYLEEL